MFKTGKCPKCEKVVQTAKLQAIDIGDRFGGPVYNGVAALCQHCDTILGVAIDPVAIKSDIVREVKQLLGKK